MKNELRNVIKRKGVFKFEERKDFKVVDHVYYDF